MVANLLYTSDVEDVRTLGRILVMLFALGPLFVPTSYFLFGTFAIHTGSTNVTGDGSCTANRLLLKSGLLSGLFSTLVLPLYTLTLYSLLSKRNICFQRYFTDFCLPECSSF